jgi:hypothetical protein
MRRWTAYTGMGNKRIKPDSFWTWAHQNECLNLELTNPEGAQVRALHTVSRFSIGKKCSDLFCKFSNNLSRSFKNNKPCHAGLVTASDLRILSTNVIPNCTFNELHLILNLDRDNGLGFGQ